MITGGTTKRKPLIPLKLGFRGFFFSVFLKEEQMNGSLDVDFIPKS